MTIKNVQHVEPGDLITAPFFNSLLDDIVDLQSQLDALGSAAGTVEITELDPPGDVVEARTLTIRGRNFAVPAVLNVVSFDSKQVDVFLSGTDSQLIIDVPSGMPNVPGDKILMVKTPQKGSALRTVHVVPAPTPVTGKIVISDRSGSLGTIVAGTTYPFQFELNGVNLNRSERFRVKAVYNNAVGATASDWDANTTYVGTSGAQNEIAVDANTKVTVGVLVKVPSNAQRVDMHVDVVSVSNDPLSSATLPSIPITVGAVQAPSSGAVTFGFGQQTNASVSVTLIGSVVGLAVQFRQAPIVQMNATYTIAGTYAYGPLQIETDAGPEVGVWSADSLVPSTLPHSSGDSEVLQFLIHAPAAAPADGLQRYLRIVATRQDVSPSGQLQSFYRFPIEGF